MPKFQGNYFFQKIVFCAVKKRILKNIPKVWHLPKRDLPKIIIIQQPSDEPAHGLQYKCYRRYTWGPKDYGGEYFNSGRI
jgi:hypothetical protein